MPRVDLFFEKWFKFSKTFKENLIMKNKNKKIITEAKLRFSAFSWAKAFLYWWRIFLI